MHMEVGMFGVLALSTVDKYAQLKALHCSQDVCDRGCVPALQGALLPRTDCMFGVQGFTLGFLCTPTPSVVSHCVGATGCCFTRELGEDAVGGAW
jgi:hypothetical protein